MLYMRLFYTTDLYSQIICYDEPNPPKRLFDIFKIPQRKVLLINTLAKEIFNNSDTFPNNTFHGCRFIHSHICLEYCFAMEEDFYMYKLLSDTTLSISMNGISKISNQSMAMSIIFI